MSGRLDKYDDFIQKSQYNMTEQKKPMKKVEEKQVKKQLQTNDINIIFNLSRERKLICYLFYNKKNSLGKNEKIYRMVVIPERQLIKRGKMYIEIIDVKAMIRKLIRRDRIVKAKLTDKKFNLNQSSISYKK